MNLDLEDLELVNETFWNYGRSERGRFLKDSKSSRNSKSARRRTSFECRFDCNQWRKTWSNEKLIAPKKWSAKPQDTFNEVEWIRGKPATNVPSFPFSGNYTNVRSGPGAVNIGGLTLDEFEGKGEIFSDSDFTKVKLKALSGQKKLERVPSGNKTFNGGVPYQAYRRKSKWTPAETTVSDNCLSSNSPVDGLNNPGSEQAFRMFLFTF